MKKLLTALVHRSWFKDLIDGAAQRRGHCPAVGQWLAAAFVTGSLAIFIRNFKMFVHFGPANLLLLFLVISGFLWKPHALPSELTPGTDVYH